MKKNICCFLSLVLIMISFSAAATSDKEILFKNIEWGSTASKAKEVFREDKIYQWSLLEPTESSSSKYFIDHFPGIFPYSTDNFETKTSLYTYPQGNSLKVAGYEAEVYLFFANLPNSANKVYIASDWDSENTSFYRAIYKFRESKEGMLEDLERKLTGIYGQPDETEKSSTSSTKTTIWNGKNNTFCVLKSNSISGIFLSYGTYDADELLEKINTIILAQEENEKKKEEETLRNNTDGL